MTKSLKKLSIMKANRLFSRTGGRLTVPAFFAGIFLLTSLAAVPGYALRNPAVVYCKALGFQVWVEVGERGEGSHCAVADGLTVNAWDFLKGKAAPEYSFCTKIGLEVRTVNDPVVCESIFSSECAVCVLEDGTEVEVTRYMGLGFEECSCGDGLCSFHLENYENCPADCPSGGDDGYCDGIMDGILDPDCGPGEDPDETVPVAIDIKPGSYPNCLNINGNGVIPVAILGSADFDVSTVDVSTLSFAGLQVRIKGNDKLQCAIEDVSGDFTTPEGAPDGYADLVCQFVDEVLEWTMGEDTADITGQLLDGRSLLGTDEICIVP